MMHVPVNASSTWQSNQSMHSFGPVHSRTAPGVPLLPVASNQWKRYPLAVSASFDNIRAAKRVKHLVIFDWDDTLFPTTAFSLNEGKDIKAIDLLHLGLSIYKLLEKYIDIFGTENLCIVTNGKKSWVLDSLKLLSDLYQACFDGIDDETEQKEKGQDYFAAIYNTLISSHSIPIVSAQDEFANRYPQVTYNCDIYIQICTVR